MALCVICRTREATQEHHVTYEPIELKIDICGYCHVLILKHGTGSPTDLPFVKTHAVRGVDSILWKAIKTRAVLEGKRIGEIINVALVWWLQEGVAEPATPDPKRTK